jgi:hypothetical protein
MLRVIRSVLRGSGPCLLIALVALLAAVPPRARGQSLYGVDGVAAAVDQVTGPPLGPQCGYPNGPLIGSLPFVVTGPCPAPAPFAPPPGSLLGDIAVDHVNDQLLVTDGPTIAVYDAAGALLNVMPTEPAGTLLTGLGFDGTTGNLWYTDGATVWSATPSAAGSCAPPTVLTSFAPAGLGTVTDVAISATSNLVLLCGDNGKVAAYTMFGSAAIMPYSPYGVNVCGLSHTLTGIAVDTAASCAFPLPKIYVTDGLKVSYEIAGGFPAPPTFYTRFACTIYAGGLSQGLAFAARPITYGTGSGPVIGSVGESVLPSPAFAITLANAPPSGMAWLGVGLAAACPAPTFFGQPFYLGAFVGAFGPFGLSGAGTFTLPAGLPPPGQGLPCGASVYLQWLCKDTAGSGAWSTSQGLEFTLAMP